ncbi:MAG: hypothetical protein WD825_00900 [Gemmatimonadaceae bacterium]
MNPKRLDMGRAREAAAVLGLAMALAATSGTANAQLSGGQWRLPPQGSTGRRAAVQKKVEPTVVVDPMQHSLFFPSQPVAFTLVPAILMSDGNVYANFGAGFEPVLRPCTNAFVVGQPRVVASNGVVLSEPRAPTAPTYTQPVPNQLTASQQMVSSSRVHGSPSSPTSFAQFSCFGRNAAGHVFVLRF